MTKFVAFAFFASCVYAAPSDYDSRIVGGYLASRGQFPHQVSLRIYGQHVCGGSIIGENKILTAAHCIYQNNMPMTIVAGENLLSNPGQEHKVISKVHHEFYDHATSIHDIAILRLASNINFNEYVGQISLRGGPAGAGEKVTLSGWGHTSYPGASPNNLQYLSMNVIDLQTCADGLAGANPVSDGHICTQSRSGQGSCIGDTGSPLIDGSRYQIGVASWGIPCAKGAPDVFTSVPYYLNWINSH